MTLNDWIDWTQEQLGDLSRRLVAQGYYPERVFLLEENEPEFKEQFHGFLGQIGVIIDHMAVNPEGYHHFDAFTAEKMAFLQYTSLNRTRFLGLDNDPMDGVQASKEIAA